MFCVLIDMLCDCGLSGSRTWTLQLKSLSLTLQLSIQPKSLSLTTPTRISIIRRRSLHVMTFACYSFFYRIKNYIFWWNYHHKIALARFSEHAHSKDIGEKTFFFSARQRLVFLLLKVSSIFNVENWSKLPTKIKAQQSTKNQNLENLMQQSCV